MTNDFITRYAKTIKEEHDIPEIFVKASGYHLVSSLLGRFFRCPELPHGRPNVWFIISSIPGRMRRSTILRYDGHIYRQTLIKFYEKAEIEWNVWDSIIEEGTPEGIADHIQDAKQEYFTIMSPEFGGVLTRMQTRDYQAGVGSLFSKLYSGEGGSVDLSKKGGVKRRRFIPEGLYVTMFTGMQEPKQYLSKRMIRQGLLRRILICFVQKNLNWTPPLDINRKSFYDKLNPYVEELTEQMVTLQSLASKETFGLLDVIFNPRVQEKINRYSQQLDAAVDRDSNNINIYQQSLWEHLAKLSVCRALARHKTESFTREGEPQNIVTVNDNDYKKAEEDLTEVTKHIGEIISNLGEKEISIRTAREPLEKIYGFIRDAGSKGIQRQKLYLKSKMLANDLDQILSTLEKSGKCIRERQETGGRPAYIYKAV